MAGVHLISWKWDEVGLFLLPVLFLLLSGLAKLVFHHANWVSSRVPESCLLILVGLVSGLADQQGRTLVSSLPNCSCTECPPSV